MKKTILFSALALTASVFADGEMIAAYQKDKGQAQQMNNSQNGNNMQMNVVTLTSARPESDNGWYIFADALYWHADVGQTDWAVKNPDTGVVPTTYNVHELDFKWSWGFKVGLGVNMDHDAWDSNLYYTWFHTENSNQAGVDASTGLVTDTMGTYGTYTSGKAKWDIHFSMFDWELGRWYYTSKNLAIRPHVGIKGGWIDQNIHLSLTDAAIPSAPTSANERFKNNFWGVGPSAGVNTMWVLGSAGSAMDHRFCLFGDFGGALMYGHFEVKNNQTYTSSAGAVTGGAHVKGLDRNRAVAMLQGMMGLSWDTAFNRGRNHFMMKVGYELQYWFRQNQLYRLMPNTAESRVSEATLALQGLTAELRFDF